jgi:arsenite methyltransferase
MGRSATSRIAPIPEVKPQPAAKAFEPNYGLDYPDRLRHYVIEGLLVGSLGLSMMVAIGEQMPFFSSLFLLVGCGGGLLMLLWAGHFWWSSRYGKVRASTEMLRRLNWNGIDRVLDIGCGHGMLMLLVNKCNPDAQLIGMDVWNADSQYENSESMLWKNLDGAGIAKRCSVETMDIRQTRFAEKNFSKLVSSLTLHEIRNAPHRRLAVREALRLVQAGGEVAFLELRHHKELCGYLQEFGFRQIRISPAFFLFGRSAHYVIAKRPADMNLQELSASEYRRLHPDSAWESGEEE